MKISFCMRRYLCKLDLLKHIKRQGVCYGYGEPLMKEKLANKTVVVEYSSPNIAKPFHIGHLRSTILGNFLANLYERHGWRVIRLNYLGDWGTQFGLLAVGFRRYGEEGKLASDPLRHLFEVYVNVNKDVEVEKKSGITCTQQEGLDIFRQMEQGDPDILQLWKTFADISIKEYGKLYERLGVKFTDQHAESMYNKAAISIVNRLKYEHVLKTDELGRGYVEYEVDGRTERANLLKSDGTTLYITRDVAALIDRQERYKFDKIHYVVENAQHDHFQQLCGIMSRIPDWQNRLHDDIHVKFGRIEGISTRKGSVVFLRDILDEAKNRMKQTMQRKQTTKVDDSELDRVAEELGKSAIIAQDLSQRRLKPYKFTWDKVLNFKRDSGIFLQYCHARLCSMERNSDVSMADDDARLVTNQQTDNLIAHLEKYESVIRESMETLEPYHTVLYLYSLCHHVNAAYKTCHVKGAEPDVAKGYLLMFQASRVTLADGMTLIGLNPLERM